VQDYIDRRRDSARYELGYFGGQRSLADAIRVAALAINCEGKRHPHRADSKGPAGTIPSRTNAQAQVVKVLSLEAVRDALNNLVSSPAQPQYQETLATALTTLTDAAAKLAESITPSQASMIKQMGGEDFFDPQIADKVKTSIQSNAMTPSVARDFVQDLATRRSSFLSTVRSTRKNLGALGIRESALKPDSADIAFLIPRDIFKNHLSDFAG
jgi:hypothetical protein